MFVQLSHNYPYTPNIENNSPVIQQFTIIVWLFMRDVVCLLSDAELLCLKAYNHYFYTY